MGERIQPDECICSRGTTRGLLLHATTSVLCRDGCANRLCEEWAEVGRSLSIESKQGILHDGCMCRDSILSLITDRCCTSWSHLPDRASWSSELRLAQVSTILLLRTWWSDDPSRLFRLPRNSLQLTIHGPKVHLLIVHCACDPVCCRCFHNYQHFKIQPDQLDWTSV